MEMPRIESPPELNMPIGEAMFTQRAIRRLDPEWPISDSHLKTILDAASKAPSGGNIQPARFLVIRSRGPNSRVRYALSRGLVGETPGRARLEEQGRHSSRLRLSHGVASRRRNGGCAGGPAGTVAGRSRAGPLGVSLRPEPAARGARARNRLGADDIASGSHGTRVRLVRNPPGSGVPLLHSLGYPRGNFGPTSRYPTSETTSWERWDERPPWG